MLNIAKLQLLDGIRDAKYLFLSILIILAFISNGITYSENYKFEKGDYDSHIAEMNRLLQEQCNNLQSVAVFNQRMLKPPSPLSFVSESGDEMMPNVVVINAFNRWQMEYQHRNNEMIPSLPSLDWTFIIGILISLLAILLSYDCIAGEKKMGTLKLVLSNPVSRISLFAGKYLGMLFAMVILLILGVFFNLVTISLLEGPPITGETLWLICWALLLSILYISFFLLAGLGVSSLTHKPAVSLVVLLVIWVVTIFVIPGVGKLIIEQTVEVPSQAEVREEEARVYKEIFESRERFAANWNGDPFDEYIPQRARLNWNQCAGYRKVYDNYFGKQINQITHSRNLSSISPFGILSDGLQMLSGTGYIGVRQLFELSKEYQSSLNRFVVNMDKKDSGTPHLVYGYQLAVEPGVFSRKPVEFESIPNAASLWSSVGMTRNVEYPVIHLLFLFSFNLFTALIAFLGVAYYDPR